MEDNLCIFKIILHILGRTFIADDDDGGYYRSILVTSQNSERIAFIGARWAQT